MYAYLTLNYFALSSDLSLFVFGLEELKFFDHNGLFSSFGVRPSMYTMIESKFLFPKLTIYWSVFHTRKMDMKIHNMKFY